MPVSVREFKAHLSRYLAEVRTGKTIEISSHRKVIARVSGAADSEKSGIERLLADGEGQWAGGKPAGGRIKLDSDRPLVSELVLQDRE